MVGCAKFSNIPPIRMSMPGENDKGAFDAMGFMQGSRFYRYHDGNF